LAFAVVFADSHELDENVADLFTAQAPKSGYATGRTGWLLFDKLAILRDKWKKAGALEAAFAKDRPLGLWRQIVQELNDIKLKL